jgi:hypothetical protein
VQLAAGRNDAIVLQRDHEGLRSNQTEEQNKNGLLLVVREMETCA